MAQDEQRKQGGAGPGVDESLMRHGGLSYLEIPAADPRKSARFYQLVLDWNVSGGETDRPKFSDSTGHLIGRWVTDRRASDEAGLLPYIYVDDIRDAVARVEQHGGRILKHPYREGNLWVATFRDPAGNPIGLWQAIAS